MARPFFEESIIECARMGSDYSESYDVVETQTKSGDTYAHIAHPYPVFRMTMDFANTARDIYREDITALYHKCQGTFAGFRARHHQDFSTNNYIDAPTAFDQICTGLTATNYQICRWYGAQGDTTQSHRRIKKPVDGTALVSIGVDVVTDGFSVDYATGVVTFTDSTFAISAIALGANTTITAVGHTYHAGDSVALSGIVGTAELNGMRAQVLGVSGDDFTLDIDSTAFTAYTSGGDTHTAPLEAETVCAGCYFDLPVHFIDALNGNYSNANVISGSFMIEELLNP